jgi:hypothetical protein
MYDSVRDLAILDTLSEGGFQLGGHVHEGWLSGRAMSAIQVCVGGVGIRRLTCFICACKAHNRWLGMDLDMDMGMGTSPAYEAASGGGTWVEQRKSLMDLVE